MIGVAIHLSIFSKREFGEITMMPGAIIAALLFLSVPIIIFKKKHAYKIPIFAINIASVLLLVLTIALIENREIGRDSSVLLFIVSGLMWLGSFIWSFITPKNKE